MTEAAWLGCADPATMLGLLRGEPSDRKLRLFAVSCYRQLDDALLPRREKEVFDIAERYADHMASEEDLLAGHEALTASGHDDQSWLCCLLSANIATLIPSSLRAVTWLSTCLHPEDDDPADPESAVLAVVRQVKVKQVAVLREIFGNPFRPVAVKPEWLTSTVVTLATGIYQEKAFARMPILANTLQHAGCDSDELLNHLRGDEPHVRGCWALDLLLGKGSPNGATGNRTRRKQKQREPGVF